MLSTIFHAGHKDLAIKPHDLQYSSNFASAFGKDKSQPIGQLSATSIRNDHGQNFTV